MFTANDELVLGVDVSHHQVPKRIDYTRLVQEGGISFAMVRTSYGGKTDVKAAAHIEGFRKAGAKVGVYGFMLPSKKPVDQARRMHKSSLAAGWDPANDLPFFLDVELPPEGPYLDRHASMTPQSRAMMIGDMLLELRRLAGRDAGLYTGPSYWGRHVRAPIAPSTVYWAARYPSAKVNPEPLLAKQPAAIAGKGREFAIWQYSSKGRLPGYVGNIDLNLARASDVAADFRSL